jgi:peptidoglycan/xylan/chitin deacetylase (PgdA/CDA1 family)
MGAGVLRSGGTNGRPGARVLTFHRIGDVAAGRYQVSWRAFSRLLDLIVDLRIAVSAELDPAAACAAAAVLTFDDGTQDHLHVGEELARRSLPGVFFIPSAKLDQAGRLRRSDLGTLRAQGHVVGSHGVRHVPLLDERIVRSELRESKAWLEDILGEEVLYLAPPGGLYRKNLVDEVRESGYGAARSLAFGVYDSGAQRWRIPSLTVTEAMLNHAWIEAALLHGRLPPQLVAVDGVRRTAAGLRRLLGPKGYR